MGVSLWEGNNANRLATALETVAAKIDSMSEEKIQETVDDWFDGHPSSAQIDDSSTANNKVWSAQKVNDLKSAIDATLIHDSVSNQSIATISDGADGLPVEQLIVGIDPVQDLHGQDAPYPGGGGKNLLPKGSSSETNGITFTVNNDGTVTVTGTASATAFWGVQFTIPAGTYILNGCPSDGSQNSYYIDIRNHAGGSGISGISADSGSGSTFTLAEELTAYVNIRIASGYACPSGGLLFKPMIRLSSVSDATFAPYSNICPITGWTGANVSRTGKNLFDKNNVLNGYLISNGKFVASNSGEKTIFTMLPPGTYFFSKPVSTTVLRCVLFDDVPNNNDFGEVLTYVSNYEKAFTISGWKCFTAYIYNSSGEPSSLADVLASVQIELGSTASAYSAYSGQTYPISWQTEAGTVYGGTLTVNKDGTGTLVVDSAYVEYDGSNDESWQVFNDSSISQKFISVSNVVKNASVISNKYRGIDFDSRYNNFNTCYSGTATLCVNEQTTNTVSGWRDILSASPLQMCYELDTPVTYNLTNLEVIETLKGINNVWADTGETAVDYPADTKLYIAKVIASLS